MSTLLLHRAREVETSMGRLAYLIHEPPGFAEEPRPLLMFLHGAGERGDDIVRVSAHGIPRVIERGRNLPFVCVSPQCPAHRSWTELTPALRELLDDLCPRVRADLDRIYLTGLSMGGFGVWKLAAETPERFAALAPVCGGGDPSWAPRLRHLPTWAFHGALDDVVPVTSTQRMVRALENVGAPVKLTIYEGVGHDSWTRTYDDPELYEWLLRQQRRERSATESAPSP